MAGMSVKRSNWRIPLKWACLSSASGSPVFKQSKQILIALTLKCLRSSAFRCPMTRCAWGMLFSPAGCVGRGGASCELEAPNQVALLSGMTMRLSKTALSHQWSHDSTVSPGYIWPEGRCCCSLPLHHHHIDGDAEAQRKSANR